MKKNISFLGMMIFCFFGVLVGSALGLDNLTKIKGLQDALNVGIKSAIAQVGVENGFFNNSKIKIELPENIRKIGAAFQAISGSDMAETLTLKMNRAAEKATPKALEIFLKAIKGIKFDDATKILTGGEKDAATKYLELQTSDSLKKAFYPIVKGTMEEVDAVKAYNEYIGNIASNFLMKDIDLDINRYVAGKAIDGLFKIVAEQEKKIRENPAAQVTSILKKVFGSLK
ncbi:MAG: DUF4197 domain-containing protein [Desulfobacterales bacterium]|nr:DUF4197 domain-containing protein [Desulfobacterales bacterium]MBF0396492.1 DUF4197 domain-containing protein [Desulfobacterales bacterium]